MKKICLILIGILSFISAANSATVVATVNGNPITDIDITSRVELMNKQGKISSVNRKLALQNIIDDYIKINHAAMFNVKPTDKDADKELKHMNMGNLSESVRSMARLAIRADISWGVITARTIVPTIKIDDSDIMAEKTDLIIERGLPLELTMLRLTDVPSDIKLSKPKNCDDAIKIVENAGGYPQKITAMQYELSDEIRSEIADLPILTWSKPQNGTVFLICKETKTKEYQNLDEIIKQNAVYKKASVVADQQLKQLRRKAVIIINDERYK